MRNALANAATDPNASIAEDFFMGPDCNYSYNARSTTVAWRRVKLSYMWPGRGKRIERSRESLGLLQHQLAERVGVSRVSVIKWEADDAMEIKGGNLHKLAAAIGRSAHWILFGDAGDRVEVNGGGSPTYSPSTPSQDYLYVDRVRGPHLSAGTGEVVWDYEEIEQSHAFRRDWMQRRSLNPARCKLYEVKGESMAPTLNSGDTVMINMADREVVSGELFALVADDGLRVKRLHKRGGGVWMHSDNPDQLRYSPELIEDHNAAVIGRVVWRGGAV